MRPEGFIPDPEGPLACALKAVEIMGRDTSVVASHDAFTGVDMRAIISTDDNVDPSVKAVRFSLKPHKVHLFDRRSELRVPFDAPKGGARA